MISIKVNILGNNYTILFKSKKEDIFLKDCDGYCDKTSKKIVVSSEDNDCQLEDFESYQRKVLRHEIIHAFLFESGLAENWEHIPYGQEETVIDWLAIQFPKIFKVFEKCNCVE